MEIEKLEIYPHLSNINDLISKATEPVAIIAKTGSGKSLGLPYGFAQIGLVSVTTVPTRSAAINLYERQKMLSDAKVGYAAEGQVKYNKNSKIIYVTAGHAKNKLLSYFSKDGEIRDIDFCDILLVDEFHNGSLDNTIILSLWLIARKKVKVPKLVITTATPTSIIKTIDYYIDIKGYNVDIEFLNKDPDPKKLLEDTAIRTASIKKPGYILVFASGKAEVINIANYLKKLSPESIIIEAYGSMSKEELSLINQNTKERKIVVSTNVAETSITIPDIEHVVDTMYEKRSGTSLNGGKKLSSHLISKNSSIQRQGRTGRTKPGIYYPMCTKETYNNLESHLMPEIDRIPIHETVIQFLSIDLNPEIDIVGVNKEIVKNSIKLLNSLGMLLDNKVTSIGEFSTKMQYSVKNSLFLWEWLKTGAPIFPGLVVASIIDSYGPSYFFYPNDMDINEVKKTYFKDFIGKTDLHSCLNLINSIITKLNGIHYNNDIIPFNNEFSINNKQIKALFSSINTNYNILSRYKKIITNSFEIGNYDTENVYLSVLPILQKIYSNQIYNLKNKRTYIDLKTNELYLLDRKGVNKLIKNPPERITSILTQEIENSIMISFFIEAPELTEDELIKEIEFIGDPKLEKLVIEFNKGNKIQFNQWSKYNIKDIIKAFKIINVKFPYLYRFSNLNKVYIAIKKLKTYINNPPFIFSKYDSPSEKLNNKFKFRYDKKSNYISILGNEETYNNIDWINDFFFEEARMQCKRTKLSPFEAWNSYNNYLKNALLLLYDNKETLDLKNLRDALYKSKTVEACSYIRATFMGSILKLLNDSKNLKGKKLRILDIGSGWGGKLLASKAINCSYYYGLDPNNLLLEGYNNLIKLLGNNYTFSLIGLPENKLNNFDKLFDIVLISFPSYDSEIYSDDSGQSILKYPNKKDWYNNFLYPSLNLTWSKLNPGGYFCVQSRLIDTFSDYIQNFNDSYFCGPISLKNNTYYRSIWIWEKLN